MIVTALLAYRILRSVKKGSATQLQGPWHLTGSQGDICATIQSEYYIFIPENPLMYVTHLMNHMENQISALSNPFPSLDDLLKNWFDVGSSWLKYLLLIPLIILTILFVFCLFHKIIASCITKCMTEPWTKIMMTRPKAVDQTYSSICDQWL